MRRRNLDNIFDLMRQEFESMFEDFGLDDSNFRSQRFLDGSGTSLPVAKTNANKRLPVTDYWDNENEIIAIFELPGVDKGDIVMNIDDESLEVKVETKNESENKDDSVYMRSSSYSGFYRQMPLPKGIDSDKTNATFKNGVLEIRMPKKDEKKLKKKTISIE